MASEKVLGHVVLMTSELPQKKTRRKRRLVGSDRPPRKAFSLRLEADTLGRMNKMLKLYKGSRNEYIERLIEFDLQYRERIKPLNTPIETGDDDELSTGLGA